MKQANNIERENHVGRVNRVYGHIPDNKDVEYPKINLLSTNPMAHRGLIPTELVKPPTSVNLVIKDPGTGESFPKSQDPYNQGQLGSCTANGLAFCYVFAELKQKVAKPFMPSRLFIYYNERLIEGTVDQDSGAQIYDGITALKTYGVCSEQDWPYDASNFTSKPTAKCYAFGKQYQDILAHKLDVDAGKLSDHTKVALQSGFPIVMGFAVYDSFESDKVAETGEMPMPDSSEFVRGGHCVVIVGYDDDKNAFLVRNSWGTAWGCHSDGKATDSTAPRGYFWMPYAFVDGKDNNDQPYCSDFWVISNVSPSPPAIDNATDALIPVVINLEQSLPPVEQNLPPVDPGTDNGGVVNPNSP